MYEHYYGLSGKPFSIVPNPEVLFLSKNHENALTYLEYGLSERVGFILLTGEIGIGKTSLIRHMMQRVDNQMDVAFIFNTNFSSDELFRLILSEFDVPFAGLRKDRHLKTLFHFLIDRYAAGRQVLLVIDEAQNLPPTALEDVRMLSNLQTDDHMLIQIMLVGQPELKKRLQMPDFRQLAQRIAVHYHLGPLDLDQTRNYIAYRIDTAGGCADLFSPEAIASIHRHAGGIPRTINLLCDSALVYGYAEDLKTIDENVIEKVLADEICLAAVPALPPVAEPTIPGPGVSEIDRLAERVSVIERSLAELKQDLATLSQEVYNQLFVKYQELLINERRRNDELMAKYTHLLHTMREN
ncbi:ATPase [Desulfosarcina ovata subsp. sediminis]|uniref:ATPase n=1 Tax=Desulfosarcina ovata subsp. sediminis TaxID=885957 RepID=A0A5K8A0C8_9BACT|nr:AAA family ATPase [Desulfosarcina ovata]BBO85851.1 ATPase [Desulfosarcina ovata subsp. sediminis]